MALVAAPLRAQCPDGTPPPCGASSNANSVAVLDFTNLTRDTTYAYLGEGLSSEITTSLSAVPRLQVRSPGVVRSRQRAERADPRAIGRDLSVRYVVEGDFQRGGEQVRVTVRLVVVSSGTLRWTRAYTRPMADLLAVQQEIAQEVAAGIAGQLLPSERAALSGRPTTNPPAWDQYLRGNYDLRSRRLATAIAHYDSALALDSAFVRARARMAYAYGLLLDRNETFDALPNESLLARGTRAADLALALDARLSDAWMARGKLAESQNPLTFAGAREAYERAIALDPTDEEAWHQYGSLLAYLGQDSAAFAAWRRVLELDPGRPQTRAEIARLLSYQRRSAEVVPWCPPAGVSGVRMVVRECFQATLQGRDSTAVVALVDSIDRAQGQPHPDLWAIARPPTAVRDSVIRASFHFRWRSCYALAARAPGWLAIGMADSVLTALDACTPRGPRVWFFMRDPGWDVVRNDPRFQRLFAEARPPGAAP